MNIKDISLRRYGSACFFSAFIIAAITLGFSIINWAAAERARSAAIGLDSARELIREIRLASASVRKKDAPRIYVLGGRRDTSHVLYPGTVSSRFGWRERFGRNHMGIDIAAPEGSPISAWKGGTVVWAGRRGTYGLMVEIDHGDGLRTRYAHCSSIYVEPGDAVSAGEHIAGVGSTGRSTGPHLHFEIVAAGTRIDPEPWIY